MPRLAGVCAEQPHPIDHEAAQVRHAELRFELQVEDRAVLQLEDPVQALQVQVQLGQLGRKLAADRSQGHAEAGGQQRHQVLGLQLEQHVQGVRRDRDGGAGRVAGHSLGRPTPRTLAGRGL